MTRAEIAQLLRSEKDAAVEAVRFGQRDPNLTTEVTVDGVVIARVGTDMVRDAAAEAEPDAREFELRPIGFVHLTTAGARMLPLPWGAD